MTGISSPNERVQQDFDQAYRRASWQKLLSLFTRTSTKLLPFDEVSQKLKASGGTNEGVQEIPLEAIVGSCARYEDFNRAFLPVRKSDKERWVGVRSYIEKTGLGNIPPILAYQIDEAYFVVDGNHRVSIAHQMGATHIRAEVTELQTRVGFSPEDKAEDLILKAEYADFLTGTHLDESRPEADLRLTVPGKYWILEGQIEAHAFMAAPSANAPLSYQEGAPYWYDGVYLAVTEIIRERGLLQDFPDRTEADLYVWALEHRATLMENLGWEIGVDSILTDLTVQPHPSLGGKRPPLRERMKRTARNKAKPKQTEFPLLPEQNRLFFNILVAITGEAEGWHAFEQAAIVAQRERGRLWGLHLLAAEESKEDPNVSAFQTEFAERCQAAGLPGQLGLESGPVVDKLCERALMVDLVVAPLLHPPGSRLMTRLSSEFRSLIQRCPRPILAVLDQPSALERMMLAYDGSPKGREALAVAAYLATQWAIPLHVLTVTDETRRSASLETARHYLRSLAVPATFEQKSGPTVSTILEVSAAQQADLILVGGYNHGPVKELVLGSVLDELLSQASQPILICQ